MNAKKQALYNRGLKQEPYGAIVNKRSGEPMGKKRQRKPKP